MLANAVKHGEGKSATQLRIVRPNLFLKPTTLHEIFPELKELNTMRSVRSPLAGEGIFVTDVVFREFSHAVNSLVEAVAEHFVTHSEHRYLVSD